MCDVGDCAGASDDVMRVARRIFTKLDTDKEHFVLLALNNKNRINGYKVISRDINGGSGKTSGCV